VPGSGFRTIPQLLPPGWPESKEPFAGDYEIYWSIYIRCNNKRKLHEVHIPALEALIVQPHGGKGWVLEDEDYDENRDRSLQRIVALQRLNGPYNDRFLVDFMKTLYLLSPYWTIQARLDPSHPHGVYVNARFERETAPEARQLSMQWSSWRAVSRTPWVANPDVTLGRVNVSAVIPHLADRDRSATPPALHSQQAAPASPPLTDFA
jgi:hypothetical protein